MSPTSGTLSNRCFFESAEGFADDSEAMEIVDVVADRGEATKIVYVVADDHFSF